MYKCYRISEIGDVIGGGTPSTKNETYWNGNIPWITPKDLTNYTSVYISHGENFITEVGLRAGSKLLPKDTVLVTSRAPIGYLAIAQNPIATNQGFKSIVCNQEICNPLYLYYYLKANIAYLKMYGTGATFPEISGSIMKKIKVNIVEDINTQKKIAQTLRTYDDLIEKNNRKIGILQEMAEELYKEWFVRFRFPGYKTAKFTDGIPEGWEVKKANEIFNITIGRTPSRAIFSYFTDEKEGNHSWVSISDMRNKMFVSDTKEYLTKEAIAACNMPMVAPDTVLLSFKLTVGQVAITTEETSTNEAIAHFNTNDDNLREYTYMYLKNFNYNELGNTSAIGTAINSTIVKNMKFVLPTEDLLLKFKQAAGNIVDTILMITKQNQNLKQQRDLLLPRLMSGKLEVKVA